MIGKFKYLFFLFSFILSSSAVFAERSTPLIIDHASTDILALPESAINQAKANLHIAYGHTSHGSQLTTGMTALVGFANNGGLGLDLPQNIFEWNNGGTGGALDLHDYAMGGDVGYYPAWVNNTRAYLGSPDSETGRGTNNPDVNVIIWSWCGQVPSKYSAGTLNSEYLTPMTELEDDYPGIQFVYMTGHLDHSNDIALKAGNQIIRNYCINNNKILYDFADIESYDPDGTFYEFASDSCAYYESADGAQLGNWATEWQNSHTEGVDWYSCTSAHSEPLNANRKAYAAWWLWASLAGWQNDEEDTDGDGVPDDTDGCPTDPNKIAPGVCGCGIADIDTDGDLVLDCLDDDDDNDQMPDEWESQYDGLNPLIDDADADIDSDGYTNMEEYKGNTSPENQNDAPVRPELIEAHPYDGQGIDQGSIRIPTDTLISVRIKDDNSVDKDSIDMDVVTGEVVIPGAVNKIVVNTNDPSEYWFCFVPEDPFNFGEVISVTVNVNDGDGIAMEQYQYSFGIETQSQHDEASSPPACTLDTSNPLRHKLSADPGTDIAGATIEYDPNEPVSPRFGSGDGIEDLSVDNAIGMPLAMEPPAVFNSPITLTIPCPGVTDTATLSIYYYNPENGWVLACDKDGNIQSGGQGWMIPGSRVNNADSISIDIMHFSAAQAADEPTNDNPGGSSSNSNGGGCFISSFFID